jgi:hypothetical protein
MNRRATLLALGLAATTTLPGAAAHAAPVYAGFTCGFFAATSAAVTQPNTYVGTVFDYFYAGDTISGAAVSVTITCAVTVNGVDVVAPSTTTSGSVGLLAPAQVSFTAAPGDAVAICTEITAQFSDGSVFFFHPTAGDCKAVTQAGDGGDNGVIAQPWDREAGVG